MNLSPSDIRGHSFRAVLRGYDPHQVQALLEAAARALEIAQRDATERRSVPTDEAIKLTMMSAIRAKDDMMSATNLEIEAVRRAAQDEAEGLISAAERDAAQIMADAKRSASQTVQRAEDEAAALECRIEQLRAIVHRTENLMKGMASGALGDLAHAGAMLDEDGNEADWPEPRLQVVVSDPEATATDDTRESAAGADTLPEAVDRLLSQLRDTP